MIVNELLLSPGCTQWVLLDTVQTDFGDAYLGVYEPTNPCNGSQVHYDL